MIHVNPAEEPSDFDVKVRVPGNIAIDEMTGNVRKKKGRSREKIADRPQDIPANKFPPYWREIKKELYDAYDGICAYSCLRINPVTGAGSVDHMVPKSLRWNLVYEWSNYRLVCSLLNSRKLNFMDVLDPFQVDETWFCLELVGFQVLPGKNLNKECLEKVKSTIERLKLNDSLFKNTRLEHANMYWHEYVSFEFLKRESPFVARELSRQGKVLKCDQK